jgi:F0F1-type ATP synthase assembly protein I
MSVKQTSSKPPLTPHPNLTSKDSKDQEASSNNLENLRQLHIARELADVTWRLAVPVIGLSVLGIVADTSWGTKPWLTLLGSILGFVIAGKLVSLQIRRVTREEDQRAI